MKKLIFAVFCLISMSAIIFSQTEDQNSSALKNYSESESYTPRESFTKNSKKTRKTKEKKENKIAVEVDKSVTVPVTVLDNQGRVIIGLKKSDFQIFADGEEVSDFSLENKETSLNIVLLFDTSPSTKFIVKDIKNYAIKLVENLQPQDNIMLAEFNEKLKIKNSFTSDKSLVIKNINKARFGDGTSLYDSVEQIFDEDLNNSSARTAIILISDGVDTTSTKANYAESLVKAEKYDIPFFVIYVNTFTDMQTSLHNGIQNPLLQSVLGNVSPRTIADNKQAYQTGLNYLTDLILLSGGRSLLLKDSVDDQNFVLPKFAQELRSKYYLKFMPSETSESGKRKQLKIRVNRPDLLLIAKGSYISN